MVPSSFLRSVLLDLEAPHASFKRHFVAFQFSAQAPEHRVIVRHSSAEGPSVGQSPGMEAGVIYATPAVGVHGVIVLIWIVVDLLVSVVV